jgi:integrase
MGGLQVKNLCQKGGRFYYRRKVNGRDEYLRLPPPWHPDHARAYAEAANETERDKPDAGSLAALVAAYRASPEYRLIPAASTRGNYGRYLDMIVAEHGKRSVTGVTVARIYDMRDKYQDKPGKANNWLTVFKALMSFAAKKGWRRDNPALGITALPIGEHEPWPAEVLEAALDKASAMTRLAIITGLCSGARIGDCVRMQHGWHDGAMMQFTTEKRKVDVAVPMHPLWLAEIAKVPRKAVTILYDRSGKPFASRRTLGERIRDLMKAIGHEGYSFHGLRKNAACYLAELGLSDTEIGAICGMTPETVRHYTKRKRAFMIARGVAEKVKGGRVLSIAGGRPGGRAASAPGKSQ